MEFFDVIRHRQSVRMFHNTPVEAWKIHKILETANSAPSAGNLQAYEIILVTDIRIRRHLAMCALDQAHVAQAPVVLVFITVPKRSGWKYGKRGETLYALQDATIACTYAQLAATALGLASCWVGAFHDDCVRSALSLPDDVHPVAILPIGYPAEYPERTPRRPLHDLVHINAYGHPYHNLEAQ